MNRIQIEDKLRHHEDIIVQLMQIIRATNERLTEVEANLKQLKEEQQMTKG